MPVTTYTTILGADACWVVDGTWAPPGYPNHLTDHVAIVTKDITGPGGPVAALLMGINAGGVLKTEPNDRYTIGALGLFNYGSMYANGGGPPAAIIELMANAGISGTGLFEVGQIQIASGAHVIADGLDDLNIDSLYMTGGSLAINSPLAPGALDDTNAAGKGLWLLNAAALTINNSGFNPVSVQGDAGASVVFTGLVPPLSGDWSLFLGTLDQSDATAWEPVFGVAPGGDILLTGGHLTLRANLNGTGLTFDANGCDIYAAGHTVSNVTATSMTVYDGVNGGGNSVGVVFVGGPVAGGTGRIVGGDVW